MAWTLAFVMASTGCGGGCFCGDDWDDDDYECGAYDDDYPWGDFQIPDLGRDSGGPDGAPDAEMAACVVGEPCALSTGCPTASADCFEPSLFGGGAPVGLGGTDDPIRNHPDGDAFVPTPLFPGGYCTTSWPQPGATLDQCNVRADGTDPVCGDCATCVDIFGLDTDDNPDEFVPGFCALRCNPSLTGNECREGYDCELIREVCFLGCQSDDECRISREDDNGVPGIQTPYDCDPDATSGDPADCTPADCDDPSPADPDACANPELNFDHLVYDTESEAICDPATSRCVNRPSTTTAAGGDPCTEDSDCEPGGRCIEETDDGRWPSGSCTKDRCDLPTNECANGGVCDQSELGHFACFQGCTLGGFDTASDPSTWVAEGVAQTTCREGYGCAWRGLDVGGAPDNGVCLPASYNPSVTTPNVGAACTDDSDCFSPFGHGFCITTEGFPEGYCSVYDCAAPWFTEGTPADQNVCGEGAFCVTFDEDDPRVAFCLQECSIAEQCGDGLACTTVAADRRGCWPTCESPEDCRVGERCTPFGCE
jgi:hypothetical protein